MDKPNADFDMSIKSVQDTLQFPVVPIVIPILSGTHVEGLLSLIDGSCLMFNDTNPKWSMVISFGDNLSNLSIFSALLINDWVIY